MSNFFKIHPAIGIARLGDSPTDFYLAPEQAGALPIRCDNQGHASLNDQGQEQPTDQFKDAQGRIKRQAARFRVYVYQSETDRQGRELKVGDVIEVVKWQTGELLKGKVLDIQWTVYLANKKSSWYQFQELAGEHGYAPDHPLRNADVTDPNARQKLIIDPGPQTVSYLDPAQRRAEFAQGKNPNYPQSFPPPLQPNSVETLGGVMTNQQNGYNRLIVLGGYGNSGSFKAGFGEPHITSYANNPGWFDDTSDGPVTAQISYQPTDDDGQPVQNAKPQTVNVDVPAWVIVGYPRYAPQIVDVVTMDDVVYDVAVRYYNFNPEMYGRPPFDGSAPKPSDATAKPAWNDNYYPYFYRDVWPILTRPNEYQWVMVFDPVFGGDPHNTTPGGQGNLDEAIVSVPPHAGEDPAERTMRADWRRFIYEILRKPGEENQYLADVKDKHNYQPPLMPLLCGDNPLANTLPSKFLRLTETQLFILRQWADGKFINERQEGIAPQVDAAQPAGVDLDRGVLSNLLGGSFCPGAETSWIIRNPAIYASAYRIKQAAYTPSQLSLTGNVNSDNVTTSNLSQGLEPGDLTKYSAVPWQSDFNECSMQDIDVTYESWVNTYPGSTGDPLKPRVAPNVFWWPAHRPMEVFQANGPQTAWSNVPFTNAGDLKMVTTWKTLGFLKYNPDYPKDTVNNPKYILDGS